MTPMLRLERPGDASGIRQVNAAAFGSPAEADLVDALRAGGFTLVSLVAVDGQEVVGHILFSRLRIESEGASLDAVGLAPLSVLPAFQRQGIGSALVREGLERCRQAGESVVVVVGHPTYYPRFGFSRTLTASLVSQYAGEAFMALELQPSALDAVAGTVVYPPPFDAF